MPGIFVSCGANIDLGEKTDPSAPLRFAQTPERSGGVQSNDRGGSGCARLGKNDLTYLAIRVTIQTLPRDGDFAGPAGACCYDHIFDHNARRRTWRHCEGQRRRPALPGQTPANGGPAHVTPGSTALWDQETVGSSPATRTKNPLKSQIPEDFCRFFFLCLLTLKILARKNQNCPKAISSFFFESVLSLHVVNRNLSNS